MMMKKTAGEILGEVGAIITGSHIVYTSGRHGRDYVNKDAVYPHTAIISDLCRNIAAQFVGYGPEVVVAPAIGGVILSQWVAHHLSHLLEVSIQDILAVYAEKADDGSFVIKRGYDKLVKGKRVLVVEDILNTGGSVKKVVEAVRFIGGDVIGLGALCNRGGVTPKDVGDVPRLITLANVSMDSWAEDECPMCAQQIPINIDVGKGREFLARQKAKA